MAVRISHFVSAAAAGVERAGYVSAATRCIGSAEESDTARLNVWPSGCRDKSYAVIGLSGSHTCDAQRFSRMPGVLVTVTAMFRTAES